MDPSAPDPDGARGGAPLRTAAGIFVAATILLLLPRQYVAAAVTAFAALCSFALYRRRQPKPQQAATSAE